MSGGARHARTPSDPLEPHLASQNRVLVEGACKALPPNAPPVDLEEAAELSRHFKLFPAAPPRSIGAGSPALRFCLAI